MLNTVLPLLFNYDVVRDVNSVINASSFEQRSADDCSNFDKEFVQSKPRLTTVSFYRIGSF